MSYVKSTVTIDVWLYKDSAHVDINTADVRELSTLPGIGSKLAEAIVRSRPFRNIDDLGRVGGIGLRKLETLRPFLEPTPQRPAVFVRSGSVRGTINVNNLNDDSQKFLAEYRKLEKSFDVVKSKPQPRPQRRVLGGDTGK